MYWVGILDQLVEALIPIGICVVLPVLLVWTTNRTKRNRDKLNAEIIIKAIENNSSVDTQKLLESLQSTKKSAREILNLRLLRGCLFSFFGVASFVVSIVFENYNSQDGRDIMLLLGAPCIAIGLAYLVTYFVTRKKVDQDSENK